jgi:hypothetical protein
VARLVEVHLVLGLGLLALVAAVVVIGAPAALRGRQPPAFYLGMQRGATVLVLAEVVLGAVLFAIGRRPQTNLHLVYALAALLVMPAARSLAGRRRSRAAFYQLGGTVLLLGIIFRLTTTG